MGVNRGGVFKDRREVIGSRVKDTRTRAPTRFDRQQILARPIIWKEKKDVKKMFYKQIFGLVSLNQSKSFYNDSWTVGKALDLQLGLYLDLG